MGIGIVYPGNPYKPLDIKFLKEKNKKKPEETAKKDTSKTAKKKKDKDAFETIIKDSSVTVGSQGTFPYPTP